jgi:putative endonuclease
VSEVGDCANVKRPWIESRASERGVQGVGTGVQNVGLCLRGEALDRVQGVGVGFPGSHWEKIRYLTISLSITLCVFQVKRRAMGYKQHAMYILTNKKNGTLYVGSSSNLHQRIEAHKSMVLSGFSKKYNLSRLVYYEASPWMTSVAMREKQVKGWKREWKIRLIEGMNPDWEDLSYQLIYCE